MKLPRQAKHLTSDRLNQISLPRWPLWHASLFRSA